MVGDICLSERLKSAVCYIRHGAVVADVGTDHAYLPIFLIQAGIASRAIASDIGSGPIQRAAAHIDDYGYSDRICIVQTDGLHGIEQYNPNHILVFGMGGELISKIIREARWVRNSSVRLVLQPMSKAEILRKYLWDNGFSILGESLSRDEGRIYQTICTEWKGTAQAYSPVDCYIGKPDTKENSCLYLDFLTEKIRILRAIIDGKKLSKDTDVSFEQDLLQAMEDRKNQIGGLKWKS